MVAPCWTFYCLNATDWPLTLKESARMCPLCLLDWCCIFKKQCYHFYPFASCCIHFYPFRSFLFFSAFGVWQVSVRIRIYRHESDITQLRFTGWVEYEPDVILPGNSWTYAVYSNMQSELSGVISAARTQPSQAQELFPVRRLIIFCSEFDVLQGENWDVYECLWYLYIFVLPWRTLSGDACLKELAVFRKTLGQLLCGQVLGALGAIDPVRFAGEAQWRSVTHSTNIFMHSTTAIPCNTLQNYKTHTISYLDSFIAFTFISFTQSV